MVIRASLHLSVLPVLSLHPWSRSLVGLVLTIAFLDDVSGISGPSGPCRLLRDPRGFQDTMGSCSLEVAELGRDEMARDSENTMDA